MPNVSQVLNLAAFYCQVRRPQDALATIPRAGPMSGYGRMVQSGVQHCAALQSGDRAGAKAALDYLVDHRGDGPAVVLEAFLRAGRVDDAAKELIVQLEDPKHRDEALNFVQSFRRGPDLAGSREMRAHWHTLVAREDVRAAVAKVGRMERHAVFDHSGLE